MQKGSPIEKRFEAFASELFAISCYGDYVLKQAFVSTASGDYLDKHGMERDCPRIKAKRATGTLTFYVDTPASEDIHIPIKTICSVVDKPFIQFETTENAVIPAGSTEASVNAISLSEGAENNALANTVRVMVNAPIMIVGVYNKQAFTGGTDNELDEAYRERILRHYSLPLDNLNIRSIENKIFERTDAIDCKVIRCENAGELTVVIYTDKDYITDEMRAQVVSCVELASITGLRVNVIPAVMNSVQLCVDATINYGDDKVKITEKISNAINSVLGNAKIGRSISTTEITRQLDKIEEIRSYNIHCPEASMGIIPCSSNGILYMNSLEVSYLEQ